MKRLLIVCALTTWTLQARAEKTEPLPGCLTIGDLLNLIDQEDGINHSEAMSLAMAYYLRYEGRSGGVARVYSLGQYWIAETINREHQFPDIRIHKKTGSIEQAKNPIVKAPWAALFEQLEAYHEEPTKKPKPAEQDAAPQIRPRWRVGY